MEGEDDANADTSSIKQRTFSNVFIIYYFLSVGYVLSSQCVYCFVRLLASLIKTLLTDYSDTFTHDST